MYFKIISDYSRRNLTNIILNLKNYEEIQEFLHNFPEIEIVEESVGNTIIQTYYHLSQKNIRKFKLLNINNTSNKIIELFKILYNKELIYNYGDEKPIANYWSYTACTSGISGISGTSGNNRQSIFKKITKKFDPHKVGNKFLLKKTRFKF